MHCSCAVCLPCCLCLVVCGAELGVVGGVHGFGCGARCQVFGCWCCWLLLMLGGLVLVRLLKQLLMLLLPVVTVNKRVTVTDVDVLYLVAQVCLRRRSEEATAEDGSRPARHSDGEAAGPRRDWQSLHCCAC